MVGGGDIPSGKVGGKRVGLGRSELFSRNKKLSGHCQEVCLMGEGYLCDMSHRLVRYLLGLLSQGLDLPLWTKPFQWPHRVWG